MSWFGEQFSSFTEKLTEITKDVLPDSGSNSTTEGTLPERESLDSLSPKPLLDLCKEKDAEIELLMNEKILLEKSVEELDQQHQEAVNELLHLKNEAVKENLILKEKLALQQETISAKTLLQKFEHNYHIKEWKNDETHSVSLAMHSVPINNFNLMNIFGVLWKSFNAANLNNHLTWLTEQKLVLESQVVNTGDNSVQNVLRRINNYIMFLQLIAENSELFSPIIDEIATAIHFLLSNNVSESSRLTVPEVINKESASDISNLPSVRSVETSESDSQTVFADFKYVRDLFSMTPEPFICNNAGRADSAESFTTSQHVQTDGENSVQNCNALIFELRQHIIQLEEERADFEEHISELEQRLETFQPAPSSSVLLQTDETDYDRINSELVELQTYVNILEQEKSDMLHKLAKMENMMDICTSSVVTQTDECNFNSHELQVHICILEQRIADLQDEISHLNSVIDKQVSSAEIQTDEGSNLYELLQSEISSLQEVLNLKEKDYTDCQEEMSNDLNSLKEELVLKESVIQEKENVIQSLECDLEEWKSTVNNFNSLKEELELKKSVIQEKETVIQSLKCDLEERKSAVSNLKEELQLKESVIQKKESIIQSLEYHLEDCKSTIKNLTEKLNSVESLTSIETQTEEISCSCKLYELEILELKKSIDEREKEFSAIQNQTIISVNELKQEVNSKEYLIANKDSMLNSLNCELENCKHKTKYLTDELNTLKKSSENKENICSCKKYQSELEDLKICLQEKEKVLVATQKDLIDKVSTLNELLQSKESLINDKEETICTLKLELEDAKGSIKNYLSDLKVFKGKQDYAKDIDTMEECDIKMIMGNCNRCKNILNGESNDNDSKNEVKILQEKLKALDLDKNQLLCVLNEKSQECSSLKAEVHKLTNIVASEKQALYKLQQDNCLLKESRDNSDPELTKEAIQRLSRIIRDKDLEIESLKEKNSTLTTLIQDATLVPDHLQSLIEEKENLTKQINVFKADRDKIMVRYNTIDKDCRQYAAEVKFLKSALSDQKEKFDILEQKHFSVAQQYEEKQKSLINTQNEMIALKQRVSDLEQQQVDIKEKYSELLNKFNSDTMIQLSKDELNGKNSEIEKLMSANSEKDHLIQEKDCLIHDLSQQIKTLKLEYEQQQSNLSNLQIKVEELTSKLKDHEALVDKHQNEKDALELRFQDKNSELGLLKDMNERLNMSLKEKEFTMQSMTEKISSLSHYISSDHTTSDTVDINQILADSESMFSKAQSLYKERDETLLALNQSKQENQSLRNEIQRMKSSEIHLKRELERLRMHLLEIEENYTTEALKAEEREKELRDELVEVRRRAEISNTAIVDTNQRASIQIASLQEQLSMIANQRDQALAQVSALEDKVQQHAASVSKLQLVLEQMQRGNERKVKEAEKKYHALLENQKQLHRELDEKLQAKEMQLAESTQALEAASRLSEQLDAKEEIIANLKSELSKTESKIKSTAREIDTIKSNTEGKVDRVVMKSLVLGYFSTPPGQKSEVIRLLARVLDFNQEEMEKAGIVVGRSVQRNEQRGLFSSLFSRLPVLSPEKTPPSQEKSFTTLFVQFLENESQPIVPMPFPVEKMAHDLSFKQHSSKKSPTTQKKNISRSNPLLLDIDSAFPTFAPVPAVEYSQSPAPAILREVLE